MKISFVLICTFLMATNSFAYQYYYFDRSKMSTNVANFKTYISPQLRSMQSDFYQAVKKLAPLEQETITIRTNAYDDSVLFNNWLMMCHTISPECTSKLFTIYDNLRVHSKNLFELNEYLLTEETPYIDSILVVRANSRALIAVYDYLLHKSEEMMISFSTNYLVDTDIRSYVISQVNDLDVYSQNIVGVLLPEDVRQDFSNVWLSVFVPIEKYCITKNNFNYLLDNLDDININWNSFHLKMSKGVSLSPEKIDSILTTIQNRWNSILKFYLKDSDSIGADVPGN